LNALLKRFKRYNEHKQITVFHSPINLKELMEQSIIAISSAGSTLYELCACATPAISFSCADNQQPIAEYFAEKRIIPYVGDIRTERDTVIKQIVEQIYNLYSDKMLLSNLITKMRAICDGKGAERVAEILVNEG